MRKNINRTARRNKIWMLQCNIFQQFGIPGVLLTWAQEDWILSHTHSLYPCDDRKCSIRMQMKWWKTCAISACISQGSHSLPPQHAKHSIQEEELLCVFIVRESNPCSCSFMSFQQTKDGAVPMYMVYTICPRNWKKS